ncbi:MAG: MarR family winged helix-turn-helix transcriptional regulator [Pseudorhodoplanes sp.]
MPGKRADPHPIYDKPGHLIRRLQQIAVALFAAETRAFDLTSVQYAALAMIRLNPGIDQTALANAIALDRSTIAEVVARLQAKGLIQRGPGQADRRTKVLFATARGEALLARIEPAAGSAQSLILAPLRPAQRTAFMEMLGTLVAINNEHSRAPLRVVHKGKPSPTSPKPRTRPR